MATRVVETEPRTVVEKESSSTALISGVVAIIIVALLIFYGLPMINRMFRSSTPSVNIPDKVDVNIKQQAPIQAPAQQPHAHTQQNPY